MTEIKFVAVLPSIQSAIKLAGEGSSRITLDAPESELAEVIKLMLFKGKAIEVSVRPYEPDKRAITFSQEELDDAEREKIINDVKPYGKQASSLYKNGFFYNPAVLKAIGTDEEFLEWVREQPCAMTGEFDRNEDGHGNFIERCEAAHYRAIANGAGAGLKPPYSAIPLIRFWHGAQTKLGERVFDTDDPHRFNIDGDPIKGREWMESQRNSYVKSWARHKLATDLGCSSMGYVEPNILLEWAEAHDLKMFLPAVYKHENG